MPNFEVLVNKMMFDPGFADRMQNDPAAALNELGIEPTPERLDAIRHVDFDAITRAAEAIGAAQETTKN